LIFSREIVAFVAASMYLILRLDSFSLPYTHSGYIVFETHWRRRYQHHPV